VIYHGLRCNKRTRSEKDSCSRAAVQFLVEGNRRRQKKEKAQNFKILSQGAVARGETDIWLAGGGFSEGGDAAQLYLDLGRQHRRGKKGPIAVLSVRLREGWEVKANGKLGEPDWD